MKFRSIAYINSKLYDLSVILRLLNTLMNPNFLSIQNILIGGLN